MSNAGRTELRRKLAAHAAGPGHRYAPGLRAAVVEHARAERRRGRSLSAFAAELGIREATVHRWLRSDVDAPLALRPIEVVHEAPTQALVVVSPGGVRVEGLSLADAVALVRALG